jgi:chemotaxis signal transduction protein
VEKINDERPFVRGMAMIGGESIPVLDLAALFTGSEAEAEMPAHAEIRS